MDSKPLKQVSGWHGNLDFVAALAKHAVRLIVIGGVAVHFLNSNREFDDLDLLVQATSENAQGMFLAFADVHRTPGFSVEEFISPPKRQIRINSHFYLDLVASDTDVNFDVECERAARGQLGQNEVRFASVALLVHMKDGTGRAKDEDDLALLRKANA
jgi:hypothetical protein